MSRNQRKPVVVVVGPLSSTGGMATSMRLQLAGSLRGHYDMIALDNSKRTPLQRSMWAGIAAQAALLHEYLRCLRRHRPVLIHIHTCSGLTYWRSVVDLLVAKAHRRRVLLHIRGGRFDVFLRQMPSWQRRLANSALSTADGVVVLSKGWARRLSEIHPHLKTTVVPNGVVLPPTAKRWRSPRISNVVFVGTLARSKGTDDLIAAVQRLPRALRAAVRLRLIGPDPDHRRDFLADRIKILGLEDSVQLLGVMTQQEVRRELNRAAVFALPSYAEGLPNALLEAMACGLPVLSTTVGAIPEVVRDGQEGFLVAPGDGATLSRRLKKLLADPELCRTMGRAARRRARLEFNQRQTEQHLGQVYGQLLAVSGAVS